MINSFIESVRPYKPLIIVIALSIVLTAITAELFFMPQMIRAMGFFLVFLSMLKLFDVNGFEKGFRKYDILSQKIPIYGRLYPFIELALGLMYVAYFELMTAYWLTLIIMSVGLLGIIRSKRAGQTLKCACMGNILQVPLSTVSMVENGSMIVMSAAMILYHSL